MPKTRGVVRTSAPSKPSVPATSITLPTPPRTATKRKRSRSRVTDSDTEDDELSHSRVPSPDQGDHEPSKGKSVATGAVVLGNKKRKTLDAIAEELSEAQVEEDFWMGSSKDTQRNSSSSDDRRSQYRTGGRSRAATRSPSSSPPPAPHLLRRERTGLVSPPPSRRQPKLVPRPATPPASTSSRRLRSLPTRDSPNNPFLSDDSSAPDAEAAAPEAPSTPKPHAEKPTVTWVFRGTRVEFANPLYRSPGSPAWRRQSTRSSPRKPSRVQPTSLIRTHTAIPEARRKAPPTDTVAHGGKSKAKDEARASWDSSDEEGETSAEGSVEKAPTPKEVPSDADLQAAMAARIAHQKRFPHPAPQTKTRAKGAPRIPVKESDPARRAMGPVRVERRHAEGTSR
ncbi:hypothetical protein B0H21DRAFT_743554 [Amylocystis lapponica]|nr:hypothetical protein B0H21DRAFT_743554 [Amylocystis lapponica]